MEDRGRLTAGLAGAEVPPSPDLLLYGDSHWQMLIRIPRKGDRREWPEAAFNCGFRIVDCGLSVEDLVHR